MIKHIIFHELRTNFREGKVRALTFIVLCMSVIAMILSLRDYQISFNRYQENLQQARLNWENQTEKNPHDAAHDGTYVIKPIYPLSILDEGIRPYSGQVIHLGAHERKQSSINESKDLSGMFRFGELTPNFILVYVFPLLLIFLGYNVFTEEKESQTIRLLLAQGVSLRQLSIGKWFALVLQMLLLFLLFFLIAGICYFILRKDISVSIFEWLSFSSIYLCYFTFFINLVVLVSAKAKSSGASLTILLSIWIAITLIVPKVSTNLSSSLYPFPTLQNFKENIYADQAKGLNGHNFWNEAAKDFQQKVLNEYGVNSLEDLPVEYSGLLLAEGEKYESEIYTKHFDLLQEQYEKQRTVYRICSVISPLLPLRFVSMAITRTDYGFLWHFENEAEKYRVELNTVLNMNIAENAKGVEQYKATADLWEAIPKFNYQWQAHLQIITEHIQEFIITFLWLVISFLAMVFFNRNIMIV